MTGMARGGNDAQRRPERAGGVHAPPEPHERGAVSAPSPTPDPGGFRVVTQPAPDLRSGAILTAFGAVVTGWLLSVVPPNDVSLLLAVLLPPLCGYEIGAQCAGKAPRGRERTCPMRPWKATRGGSDSRPVADAATSGNRRTDTNADPSPRPPAPVVSSQCAAGSCAPTRHQAAPSHSTKAGRGPRPAPGGAKENP